MAHPNLTPRTYFIIYLMLLLLTLTTVLIAERAHLGKWEVPVALGIAVTKTILVALFFMHLLQSNWLVWLICATGVLFLGIMLAITWSDYVTRDWLPLPV
jgi:cytochrome c oxidase subunit 4